MGLSSLLSALFGGAQQSPQMVQPQGSDPVPVDPQHTYGRDADGNIMAMGPGGQPGIQAVNNPDPVGITAVRPDPWKPRHQTILGALGDAYLEAHGMKPGFSIERDKRSMEEAMSGFDQNPMKSIRRVEQMNPDMAWKMYNQQVDNTRQGDNLARQNSVLGLQQDRYLDGMVGNMMYSAAKSKNPAAWGAMRTQALAYGKRYGKDYSELIPDTPDMDNLDSYANGFIPAAKQAAIGEQTRNHDLQHGDRAASLNERAGYHQGVLKQGGARVGIAQQNADTAGRNADTSAANLDLKRGNEGQGQGVQTKYGPAMIAKDGKTMTLYPHGDMAPHGYDGKGLHYIKVGGKWVPANSQSKQ